MEEMFKIEKKDDVTVLSTGESLGAEIAPMLKDAVKELAREHGLKLIIDMQKTNRIDSTGCGALVAPLRALRTNNGEMKIARPNRQVLTLLELTMLNKVFEIHEDLDGAIKSFS